MLILDLSILIDLENSNEMIMTSLLAKGYTYQDVFNELKEDGELYFGGSTVFYPYEDGSEDEMNIHEWFEIAIDRVRKLKSL